MWALLLTVCVNASCNVYEIDSHMDVGDCVVAMREQPRYRSSYRNVSTRITYECRRTS